MDQPLFYYLAAVPVLGIAAQWMAWRLKLPSILLLLVFGIALGELLNYVQPEGVLRGLADSQSDFGRILFPLVSLAVAVILFEGGMTLHVAELRQATGNTVLRLVTVGAAISWGLTAVAAKWLLPIDWRMAALLGAVLVVTGPTVVAPLLRQVRPVRRVGSIAKWEGIVIDPVGAVLAVLVFEQLVVHSAESWFSGVTLLAQTIAIGGVLGVCTALLLVELLRRYWIPDFLHGVVFLSAALGVFAASNWLQEESGLVTVTVLGVVLANQKKIPLHHVMEFKEHLRVFLISCLFIVLGSRLDIAHIRLVGFPGLAFLAIMIVVVRPAAVMVSTMFGDLNWRERVFLACLAPRGIVAAAVSSVFALKLSTLHLEPGLAEQAGQMVSVTFLIIVGTVLVYGLSAGPLARRLGLADPDPQGILFAGAEPWIREIARVVKGEGFQVVLIDTNYANVAAAKMDGMSSDCSSILSEHVRDEVDLSGVGRLLAMTANDEVNALAVREYAHVFGRANVFQLVSWDARSGRRTSLAERLRGRVLFGEELHHDALASRVAAGSIVKRTQLSDNFSYDDFREMYGDTCQLLFVVQDGKNLLIQSVDEPLKPAAGDVVIALVDAPREPADS